MTSDDASAQRPDQNSPNDRSAGHPEYPAAEAGHREFSMSEAAHRSEVARLRAQVSQLATQNERLATTLRDARDQIVTLKAEVDRLAQPPKHLRHVPGRGRGR